MARLSRSGPGTGKSPSELPPPGAATVVTSMTQDEVKAMLKDRHILPLTGAALEGGNHSVSSTPGRQSLVPEETLAPPCQSLQTRAFR